MNIPKYKRNDVVEITGMGYMLENHLSRAEVNIIGSVGRVIDVKTVQNPMALTGEARDTVTYYYTLSVEKVLGPVTIEEKYLQIPRVFKPLLAIRRKARRNGGEVSPGMRRRLHPLQVKEKTGFIIDTALIPHGMTINDCIKRI